MGYLQGVCTDGQLLTPVIYGVNDTGAYDSHICPIVTRRFMGMESHYDTPADGNFPYRTRWNIDFNLFWLHHPIVHNLDTWHATPAKAVISNRMRSMRL